MKKKIFGIVGALIALAIAVFIMVYPKKPNAISRDEILEKAREAKKIKSMVGDNFAENLEKNE